MTVTNELRAVQYIGDDVTTIWAFSFNIPTEDEAEVRLFDQTTGLWTLVPSSQYTVTGAGNEAGGTITYPISGTPITTTQRIQIQRVVGYTQDMDIPDRDTFDSSVLEEQLDDIVYQTQQNRDESKGALTLPAPDVFDTDLPPKDLLPFKYITFDENGEPVLVDQITVGTEVSQTEQFNITTTTNTVTLSRVPATQITVHWNGVYQHSGFTLVGNVITFDENLINGDVVAVAYGRAPANAIAIDGSTSPIADIDWAGFSITNLKTPLAADPAANAATKELVQWKAHVSVKEYGAKGDGVTDDTDAIAAAVNAVKDVYGGIVFFPAGLYLSRKQYFNTLRGVTLKGESTIDGVTPRATIRYIAETGTPPGDPAILSLFELRSCGGLIIDGLYFNAQVEGMTALFRFTANINTATAPFSPFGNNYIQFRNCVFDISAALATPPTSGLILSNFGQSEFVNCLFKQGGTSAIQMGEDNPTGYSTTGGPDGNTFGDGGVAQVLMRNCTFNGDIQRVNGDYIKYDGCNWFEKSIGSGMASLTVGGSEEVAHELFTNCYADAANTVAYTGVWFQGANGASRGGHVIVQNSQTSGRNTHFDIPKGDIYIDNHRYIPLGGANNQRLVHADTGAGNVTIRNTRDEELKQFNIDNAGVLVCRLLDDDRSQARPIVFREALPTDITLTNAFVDLRSTQFQFVGQHMRFKYNLNIEHKDTVSREYTFRILVNGVAVPGASTRVNLELVGKHSIAIDVAAYIDATSSAVTVALQGAQQTAATTYGDLLGENPGFFGSYWEMATIDF